MSIFVYEIVIFIDSGQDDVEMAKCSLMIKNGSLRNGD
jgi:hypothetical protein